MPLHPLQPLVWGHHSSEKVLIEIPGLAVGIGMLMWSADRMMQGAVVVARRLGVSAVGVGLVIGFGTSAPEMLVSALAAARGTPHVAIGNAIGSNIANIGLVLGAVSLVGAIAANPRVITLKFTTLLAATAVLGLVMADLDLGLADGAILMTTLVLILYLLIKALPAENDGDAADVRDAGGARAWFEFGGGFALLLIAAQLIVVCATGLARHFGVSDLLIGLTVVAVGTSLPELAAALASTWKRHHDITVGNILGSNLFNSLGVVGITALLSPTALSVAVLHRDFFANVTLTFALLALLWFAPRRLELGRLKGLVLLGAFIGYQWLLYRQEVAAVP